MDIIELCNPILLEASESGRECVVRLMLDHGSLVHTHVSCTIYAIHKAASMGHHRVLEILLAKGAIQAFDQNIDSPLHEAAEGGFVESVKRLIDHEHM